MTVLKTAALLEAALNLLNDPEELYRRSGDKGRRLLNQAVFERLTSTTMK